MKRVDSMRIFSLRNVHKAGLLSIGCLIGLPFLLSEQSVSDLMCQNLVITGYVPV